MTKRALTYCWSGHFFLCYNTDMKQRHTVALDELVKLPKESGVYFFVGIDTQTGDDVILYIGRATNLRTRVQSYFNGDLLDKRGPLVAAMINETVRIDYQTTDSVLESVVLEPYLIKKYQPAHNTRDKSDRSFVYLIITKEEFPRLLVKRQREIIEGTVKEPIKYAFGPFSSRTTLDSALKIIRKIFPYYSRKLSYDERSNVYQQIGLAPGVGMSQKEYMKNIGHIKLFFEGKKKRIISELEKQMMMYAEKQEFEKADVIKRRLFALSHIRDVSLITDDQKQTGTRDVRIEAYDVAHLQGKFAVGVMTVLYGENPDKQEYRKFKIKSFDGIDDNRALNELLVRRFGHPEWDFPALIVADGSVAQRRTVERFLIEHNLEHIKVVACKKDAGHKVAEILGDTPVIEKYRKSILLSNSEAHRFAVEYHKQLRDKQFKKPKNKKKK